MTGHRILIVEDDPDLREALGTLLRVWGHDVLEAADGEMAVEIATRNDPAVILLDLGLPDMDGYEVARRLRAVPGGDRPFLVACTGHPREDAIANLQASGFDSHVLKTRDPEELERLLASVPRRQ